METGALALLATFSFLSGTAAGIINKPLLKPSTDVFHDFLLRHPPDENIPACTNFFQHFCPAEQDDTQNVFARLTERREPANAKYTDVEDELNNNNTKFTAYPNATNRIMSTAKEFTRHLMNLKDDELNAVLVNAWNVYALQLSLKVMAGELSDYDRMREVQKVYRFAMLRERREKTAVIKFTLFLALHKIDTERLLAELSPLIPSAIQYRLLLTQLVSSGAINAETAAGQRELTEAISNEHILELARYDWAYKEDRFGVVPLDLHTLFIRNLKFYFDLDELDLEFARANNVIAELEAEALAWQRKNLYYTPELNHLTLLIYLYRKEPQEYIYRPLNFHKFEAFAAYRDFAALVRVNHALLLRTLIDVPEAVKFGTMCSVLGHELQHHMSELGLEVIEHNDYMEHRKTCLSEHMNHLCEIDTFKETKCKSDIETFSEDVCDQVGSRVAYRAFLKQLGNQTSHRVYPDLPYTEQQMFFVANALFWCSSSKDRQHIDGDIHSASFLRSNAVFSTMREFADIFGCSHEDDPMNMRSSAPMFTEPSDASADASADARDARGILPECAGDNGFIYSRRNRSPKVLPFRPPIPRTPEPRITESPGSRPESTSPPGPLSTRTGFSEPDSPLDESSPAYDPQPVPSSGAHLEVRRLLRMLAAIAESALRTLSVFTFHTFRALSTYLQRFMPL